MDVMRHRIGTTFEAEAENIRSEQILGADGPRRNSLTFSMLDASELLRRVRRIELNSKVKRPHSRGRILECVQGTGTLQRDPRISSWRCVRAIDWNVTARSGTPHIKLFEEERELTVFSSSM